MRVFKRIKWAYLLVSVFFIALGVLLIARPDTSMVYFCRFLGGVAVLFGLARIIGYFVRELDGVGLRYDFATGAFAIVAGAFMLWRAPEVGGVMDVVIGLFILVDCVFKLQVAMDSKRMGARSWWITLLFTCVSLVLGLLLAAINLVRPIALILVIAAALWIVFLRGEKAKNARLWALWLAAFLVMTAVFRVSGSLWDRHVERLLGQEIASVPWYNIYVGFNETTGGTYAEEDMDLLTAYLKQGKSAPEAQESMIPHLKERLASGINFPKLFAVKLFSFLGADQLGGYTYRFTRSERFVKLCMGVCNVFYYGVFLAAVAGIMRLFRSRALGAGLLLPLYFLGLTLAHMLVEVSDRYHYSLIPILIIFAALGFAGEERRTQ